MLGHFVGMLRWPQFDALWQQLRRDPRGWFLSQANQAAPLQPLEPDRFAATLDEIESLLKRELGPEYCGVVYVDDPDSPGFVKVYAPRTMGSMCACGSAPTPPAWVLSRCHPARFPEPPPVAAPGGRWWERWRVR
jgi:hypothetical protein